MLTPGWGHLAGIKKKFQLGYYHKYGPVVKGFEQGFGILKDKSPEGGGGTNDWCIERKPRSDALP